MASEWFRKLLGQKTDLSAENYENNVNSGKCGAGISNVLCRIFLWENKRVSSLSFIATNVVFCFCLLTEWRYYGILFASILTLLILELLQNVMPGSSLFKSVQADGENQYPSEEFVFYVKEVTKKAKRGCSKLRELRQTQPLLYLFIVCTFFLGFGIMARSAGISALALAYFISMSAFLLPLLFYHLVPKYFPSKFLKSPQTEETESSGEDEFLPDPEPEARRLLDYAANLHILESDDSKDNSVPALSLDNTNQSNHNSLDYLAPDDEIPSPHDVDRSDSDDSNLSDINFEAHHFNGDANEENSRLARMRVAAFGAELIRAAPDADSKTGMDLFVAATTTRLDRSDSSLSSPSSDSSFEIIDPNNADDQL